MIWGSILKKKIAKTEAPKLLTPMILKTKRTLTIIKIQSSASLNCLTLYIQ